jgi:hypothetical protein
MVFWALWHLKFAYDLPVGPKRSCQLIEKMSDYNVWKQSGTILPRAWLQRLAGGQSSKPLSKRLSADYGR